MKKVKFISNDSHQKEFGSAVRKLLELAEFSILLDSYDDIFSDFDPNEYSERILSDEFIIQAKKFSRNNCSCYLNRRLVFVVVWT